MKVNVRILSLLALEGLCGCVLIPPRSTKAPLPQRASIPVVQATPKRKPIPQKVEPEPVERERVATLDLINKAGVPREEMSYLSNLVRQAAGRLPQHQYGVITKDNIMVMLPQGKRLEDCQTECAVQTGREIGAHWIVTGEVIKFGGELRVSVSLHHSASGELRGSDTVKGRDVKELEGPLQGAAVGLFGELDPSLKRVAERLKRGFVFEKVTLSALPELPKLEAEAEVQEERLPSVALPSAVEASAVKGVDFGKVDVEGLQFYDKALSTDEDPKVEPQEKIKLWEQVMARVSGTEQVASARIQVWREFLAEKARVEAERQRRAKESQRRAKELERRRKEALVELNQVKALDAAQEREREQKMERDWDKLSKLLPLRVVSEEDKLSWVEAFLEAYSASAELNPYMREPLLSNYSSKLGARLRQFKAEGEAELTRRKRRAHEIELKRCELEKGVEVETCLLERLEGLEFVVISAGSFEMGSTDGDSDERPVHQVRVGSFEMSKTEVTVGQYRKCVEAGRCSEPNTDGACNWGKSNLEKHPVNCVDWGQARTFAKWVGADVDLPSEAEWEYAARGVQSYIYAGSNHVDEVGWYGSNLGGFTHSIGEKEENGFGLYDMSGNVWEWTLDEYHSSYSGAPSDGRAWGEVPKCKQVCDSNSTKRVFRGGGWYDKAYYLRVANRSASSPDIRLSNLGFRLRRRIP